MKATYNDNYRVVIDVPDDTRYMHRMRDKSLIEKLLAAQKASKYNADCIIEQVCRHVDVGHQRVYSISDTYNVCEHCLSSWTEESDTYNGGCCDKDEQNNPELPPEGMETAA